MSYTANSGSQYTVIIGEWENCEFDHWDNITTSKSRAITAYSNTVLTPYYGEYFFVIHANPIIGVRYTFDV